MVSVSLSHNGGHDDRWNMKMYVIFVLLLKVNRLRYYVISYNVIITL